MKQEDIKALIIERAQLSLMRRNGDSVEAARSIRKRLRQIEEDLSSLRKHEV